MGASICQKVDDTIDAVQEWWVHNNPCGFSIDPNCGFNFLDYSPPSTSDVVDQALSEYAANNWGGVTPEQVRQAAQITDGIARIAALNNIFGGPPPTDPIERSYEFAISNRQEQLEQFTEYYFGDVGFDVVYNENLSGAGRYGRFIGPGETFNGVVYEQGALIVYEWTIQEGWDQVGASIFHEWLEQYRGTLSHEEIHNYDKMWEEWRNQQ